MTQQKQEIKLIRGSAKIRIDERGRLTIPNRFREFFNNNELILTFHPHGCLVVYTASRFAAIEQQFAKMGNLGYLDAQMEEIVVGCAEDITLDSAGRLMLQGNLRERAAITKEVLFFGVGDSIRIWDEARWEKRNLLMLSQLQDEGLSESWRKLRI